MRELIKKLHKYEITIRKAINDQMKGDFHSVFKGSGLDFDDVRAYQYGDDVRTINWNVSAKGHGTFVKTFKEEKEQTVFFLLDVSASQEIGLENHKKLDIGREICGVLAISAIKEQSKVGLICFSDQMEKYIKPEKGLKHAYNVILNVFKLKSISKKTDLSKAMVFLLNIVKRRSIIIIISDFIDQDYQFHLKAVAKKHDLVVIHLNDKKEYQFPGLGLVPVQDVESGETLWINSSSGSAKEKMQGFFINNQSQLEIICRKNKANYLSVDTDEDYVAKLIKMFRTRNRAKKIA